MGYRTMVVTTVYFCMAAFVVGTITAWQCAHHAVGIQGIVYMEHDWGETGSFRACSGANARMILNLTSNVLSICMHGEEVCCTAATN